MLANAHASVGHLIRPGDSPHEGRGRSGLPHAMLNPVFRRQRKARVLFALSDIILTAAAFEAAYQSRAILPLEHDFCLTIQGKALVLGFALVAWVTIGLWLEIYEKLDAGHPVVILRDSARQCSYGVLCMIVFESVLRLNLSRPFLFLFAIYTWILLLLFRLTAGRLVGIIRREFAAPHYVMVVGTSERALRMGQLLEQSIEYGSRLSGFLTEQENAPAEVALSSVYKVRPIAELPGILRQHVVDEVIFAVGSESLAELEEIFRSEEHT